MKAEITLINKQVYELSFPDDITTTESARTWLNNCKRFINIGNYDIVNLDHVISIKLSMK